MNAAAEHRGSVSLAISVATCLVANVSGVPLARDEPKAHHVATCNSLLDCTHSLSFNVSTSNFVVGIDGSLCIIVEHFGTLKRQCLNGTFDANIQSNESLQQGMEVSVTSPTPDAGHLDSNGPLKISLTGSGKYDIILVPCSSQTF